MKGLYHGWQVLIWLTFGRRKVWFKHQDFLHCIYSIQWSGTVRTTVCIFWFVHCTSMRLTAVPTAPVWCDERKLAEVSGFMHQKPSWKHQLQGTNSHQRWFNKFNSHLYPVVTVCSCWLNKVSVFSTAIFHLWPFCISFLNQKSMSYESEKHTNMLSNYYRLFYLEVRIRKTHAIHTSAKNHPWSHDHSSSNWGATFHQRWKPWPFGATAPRHIVSWS